MVNGEVSIGDVYRCVRAWQNSPENSGKQGRLVMSTLTLVSLLGQFNCYCDATNHEPDPARHSDTCPRSLPGKLGVDSHGMASFPEANMEYVMFSYPVLVDDGADGVSMEIRFGAGPDG